MLVLELRFIIGWIRYLYIWKPFRPQKCFFLVEVGDCLQPLLSRHRKYLLTPHRSVVSLYLRAVIQIRENLLKAINIACLYVPSPHCSQQLKNLWFLVLSLFKLIQDQTQFWLSNISLVEEANSETEGRHCLLHRSLQDVAKTDPPPPPFPCLTVFIPSNILMM